MKQCIKWVIMFVYKISGLRWAVESVSRYAFNYKLRLRFVPTSYKLFLVGIGLTIGLSWNTAYEAYNIATAPIIIENTKSFLGSEAEASMLEVPHEPASEWKTAEFSAYTASVDETDASPTIMASGKHVYLGAIACPRNVELGTEIELKNGERYVCEDRMNVRYTNHFDIYQTTKEQARQFGRKQLEYKVIK